MSHSVFVPWITLYNRFDSGIQCREYFSDIPLSMKEHIDVMEKALKGEGVKKLTLLYNVCVESAAI